MNESEKEGTIEEQAERLARALGRQALGRELTADESAAMATIHKAAVQALKHGFIKRLAEQVTAERETETVEEFFENIKPD
ncbi:hypothetical protein V5E97_32260 [Singulisphaera sp. Ch08]|uniref:Uncharacterized protein n=1 Tax=Singulisphaera sp. Ch08 TaxID=3120278 RepID=A0AAU7CBZ9_9BACT